MKILNNMKKILLELILISITAVLMYAFVSKETEMKNAYDSNRYMDSCQTFDRGKMVARSAFMIYLSEKATPENPVVIDIMKLLKIEDSISTCKKCNK